MVDKKRLRPVKLSAPLVANDRETVKAKTLF